ICTGAVPSAVMRLNRVLRPAHSRILVPDDNSLPGKAKGPDRGSVDVLYSEFHSVRTLISRRIPGNSGIFDSANGLIGIDAGNVGARSDEFHQTPIGVGDNHVGRPERLIA